MADDWVPEACTLPTAERPLRVVEFDDLFAYVLRSERLDAEHLTLVLKADVEPAARDLARRESECCSFFTFAFESVGDDVEMRISVPPERMDVLDAIESRAR